MMAVIQALNHFNTITLGMALARTNITPVEINKFSTPNFPDKAGHLSRKVFNGKP